MNILRTLIVDDEPLAREGLRNSLAAVAGFELVGEARDGPEAVAAIVSLRPDLLLLDVQIPGFDGFEVVARIRDQYLPGIVFVSAYDRYALRAFEVHAVDYLLKPYTEERFGEALGRARQHLEQPESDQVKRLLGLIAALVPSVGVSYVDRFTVREHHGWRLVRVEEVHWFESAGNYVEIHTATGMHLLRMTMSELERTLDPRRFARIHRTTIVQVDQVSEVRPDEGEGFVVHLHSGQTLRMSRRFRDRLLA